MSKKINVAAKKIADEWIESQSNWSFNAEDLKSVGINTTISDDVDIISYEIKMEVYRIMYNYICDEIYPKEN